MTYIPVKVKTDLSTPSEIELVSESLARGIGLSGQDFEIRSSDYTANSTNNGKVWFNTTTNKLVCCQNGVLKEIKSAVGGSGVGLIGTKTSNNDIIFARVGNYYLACAPATKRTQKQWGLSGTDISLTNVTYRDYEGTSPYYTPKSGSDNSLVLDVYGASAEANNWCRQQIGASYFLPTKEELLLLFLNKALVDTLDSSGGTYTLNYISTNGLGPNGTTNYAWSSSESSSANSWVVYLNNGTSSDGSKDSNSTWVIPFTRILI